MYLVIALAIISLALNLRSIFAIKNRYEKLRRYYSKRKGDTLSPKGLKTGINEEILESRQTLANSYERIQTKNSLYLKGRASSNEFSLNRARQRFLKGKGAERKQDEDDEDTEISMKVTETVGSVGIMKKKALKATFTDEAPTFNTGIIKTGQFKKITEVYEPELT